MGAKRDANNVHRPVIVGAKTVVTTSGGKLISAEEFERLLLQLEAEEELKLAEREAAASRT